MQPARFSLCLLALLSLGTPCAWAVTVTELPDFPNTAAAALTHTLDDGFNFFQGSMDLFDTADHFKVIVPVGKRIAAASKTWSSALVAGTVTFNGEGLSHSPANANFTSGYPLSAGTYAASATYGAGISAVHWSVSIFVEAVPDYAVSVTGGNLTITDQSGNGDVLSMTEPAAGQIRFAAPGRTFSVNNAPNIAGHSGNLTVPPGTITVDLGNGDDTLDLGTFVGLLPTLVIHGGAGDDTVNFQGDITFDLFNRFLSVSGVSTANVLANAKVRTNDGSILLDCARSISVRTGALLASNFGLLSLRANQQEPPTAGNFVGVRIDGGTISCENFGLVVEGRGGDDAAGAQLGVEVVNGGKIRSNTSGTIRVTGTGGASTGQVNRGVTLSGAGSEIASATANVSVTGTAGPNGGFFGIGVALLSGGKISAGGAGTVTVMGTGAGAGGFNQGLEMGGLGSSIITAGGLLSIVGTAGPGASAGIFLANSASISTTGVGVVYADSMALDNSVSLTALTSLTLGTLNSVTTLDLGGADDNASTPKVLGLTDAELDRVTTPQLIVSITSSATLRTSAPISPANATNLTLDADTAFSSILADAPGTDVTATGALILDGPLAMPITSATPDSGFPQLQVVGSVVLNGQALSLAGTTHPGLLGDTFTIIENDLSDPISGPVGGPFLNLPEGGSLTWPGSPDFNARISYTGGSGNDAVLTLVSSLVVTNTADSGVGSLRGVLAYAASTPGADSISFDPALSGQSITLSSKILVNDSDGVTVDAFALPAGITLTDTGDVIHSLVSVAGLATLRGLSFANGGGNRFIGGGGGISNSGNLTLEQCSFVGNFAAVGGAIANLDTLAMSNCTLTTNTTGGGGGAIANFGLATLTHCTLTGNSGALGGGALFNDDTLTLAYSIVAGNTGVDFRNTATLTLVGASLLQSFSSSGTVNGTGTLLNLPPDLLPLGNYGGPTQTMPPRAGSPAIDAALGSVTNLDQRGFFRPTNGDLLGPAVRDIGACEFQDFLEVTTTADELDDPVGATRSLREAVRDAPEGGLIHFSPLVFTGLTPSSNTITLSLGQIAPPRGLSINAVNIPAGVTVDGNNASRLFFVNAGRVVAMRSLTLTRGNASGGGGGAIETLGTLALTHCTLSGNSAAAGGAITTSGNISSSSTRLTHCTLSGNTATNRGGGLYTSSARTTLTHCTVSGNTAPPGAGSGVASSGDTATETVVQNSIIAGNTNSDVDFLFSAANSFTSQGRNLIGTGNATGDFNQLGDTTGVTDPLLAPLGNYGGPTRTMALKAGSPARDAAPDSTATSDQRGFPIVGLPDIGAYEAGTFASYEIWINESLPAAPPASHAETFDYDGDGLNNLAEWTALTDPNNSSQYLELFQSWSGPTLTLSYQSKTGRNYQRQTSPNMTTWMNFGGSFTGNGGPFNWEPTITGLPRQFYRVLPIIP